MAKDSEHTIQKTNVPFDSGRIRVLRIIARMNIGGPAVQVTGLMQNLDNNFFDHMLVTGYVGENEADYLIENNLDIPVTRIDGLGRSIKPYSDLLALYRLAKVIRKFKPHIIHTHTAKAGVLGRIAWISLGYKPILIHTYHGHLLYGYFGKIKTSLVIYIEKLLGSFTDKLFAVGNKVANELLEAGIGSKEKFQVMPPGINIKEIPDRNYAAKKFELDPDATYCTYLGRITDVKKPLRFLDIAKAAKEKNLPIQFLLVGEGNLLHECRVVIKEENLPVTCLGWVTHIEDVLALTDFMILTSENEGMPISLIQAAMAGIPSIATNVGSVSEVVINDNTGFVLDFDPKVFLEKIVFLLEDQKQYKKIADAAKSKAFTNFGVKRLSDDHKVEYLNLINHK